MENKEERLIYAFAAVNDVLTEAGIGKIGNKIQRNDGSVEEITDCLAEIGSFINHFIQKTDDRFKKASVSGIKAETTESGKSLSAKDEEEKYLSFCDIEEDFMTVFDDKQKEMCLMKKSIRNDKIYVWYFCEPYALLIDKDNFSQNRYLRIPKRFSKDRKD